MSASSARSYDTIKYEVDGHKATITLNRPDALNALSPHMVIELRTHTAKPKTTTTYGFSSSPAPGGRSVPVLTSRRFPATAR